MHTVGAHKASKQKMISLRKIGVLISHLSKKSFHCSDIFEIFCFDLIFSCLILFLILVLQIPLNNDYLELTPVVSTDQYLIILSLSKYYILAQAIF